MDSDMEYNNIRIVKEIYGFHTVMTPRCFSINT